MPYVGDAARYLSPAPANVMQRKDIRDAGITLLRRLIESGEYARIIVVGHSLGTIIGFDVLRHLWPEYNTQIGKGSKATAEALKNWRTISAAKPFDRDAWRTAQRAYLRALNEDGGAWNVSDFVTFGSPLAHAGTLMAKSPDDFATRWRSGSFRLRRRSSRKTIGSPMTA